MHLFRIGIVILYSFMLLISAYFRTWSIYGLLDLLFLTSFLIVTYRLGSRFFDLSSRVESTPNREGKRHPSSAGTATNPTSMGRPFPNQILTYGHALMAIATFCFPLFLGFLFFYLEGEGPIFFYMMTSLLPMAYGYVGSTLSTTTFVILYLSAAGTFLVSWKLFRRHLVTSLFAALLFLYLAAGFILSSVYYNLPIRHSSTDTKNQGYTELINLSERNITSRKMVIDERENYLYLATHDTANQHPLQHGGLLKFNIESGKEEQFYNTKIGDSIAYHENLDHLYLARYSEKEVIELEKSSLSPTGRKWSFDPSPDGLALLNRETMVTRIEWPGDSPDLFFIGIEDGRVTPVSIPEKPPLSWLTAAMEVIPSRGEVFVLLAGNDRTVLTKVDSQGRVIDSLPFDGYSWEIYYSAHHDKLFIPSLTEDLLLEVNPDDLTVIPHKMRNGIREVTVTRDGLLVLSDYIRGMIYIYRLEEEAVIHTFLTGRKPEGVAIGPESGKIYAASSYGLCVFDLPGWLMQNDQ